MELESAASTLTGEPLALAALAVFCVAYLVVAAEEFSGLRKSKPMILGAGFIWLLVAIIARDEGIPASWVRRAIEIALHDYAALFLFLLVAMTYVNAMNERNVFAALREALIRRRMSYRSLFWITGILAFLLSPVADNLTTALVMGAVVMAMGREEPRFISLGCINVVVAANAGGAFSPFGDITTLMMWQSGNVPATQFVLLLLPSAVNFLVPALIMHFSVPHGQPDRIDHVPVKLKQGAFGICLLFGLTLATALTFEQVLHLPAFLGMMTGFSYLMFFAYHLKLRDRRNQAEDPYNIFHNVAQAEWDTLLFFFGVIFSVAGLGYLGFLQLASAVSYDAMGPTTASVLVGILSAIVDNIPVMFAILEMDPDMDVGQWLLVTLTTGVGGSLLAIGSAAGVALMGQSGGVYTFFSHLRWSWAILLGYGASIAVHLMVSA